MRLDAAARARAVDMEKRLRPVRRSSFLLLLAAILGCATWLGWWTLLPFAVAALAFQVSDARVGRSARPELAILAAWGLSQAAIAVTIALTGGPDSAVVCWLVLPIVTLPARFPERVVAAGVVFAAVLMVLATVGVDPASAAAGPQKVVMPLALLVCVAMLSIALMRSDIEHRGVAVIDALTGLLNRNALRGRIGELEQQAAVLQTPVAVIVADLDRFKAINDAHGHAAGDAVLSGVAERLRGELRAYDLIYRVGGEEFLVLLPGAGADEAARIAEQLRGAVCDGPIAGLMVTVSCGVSASEPGRFVYDEVFREADLALYEAKHAGRDCVRRRSAGAPAHAGA